MFPYTDSAKSEVDMFPRTDVLKWHSFCPLQPRGKFSLSDEADKLKRYKSSRICDIRYISFACDMPLARYVPSARERTACA